MSKTKYRTLSATTVYSHPSSLAKFWKLMTKRNLSAECPNTIGVTCSRFQINHRMGPFWENKFFVFWLAQKFFWAPNTLFGCGNLTFGEVILLKLFDPSNGFEVWDFKRIFFGQNYLQIHGPDQKVLEVWPPQKWGS